MTVRTRFAPSPTGLLHIGGVRTALFCWLYARRHGGTFILRVEDTDRERSTPEAVQAILDGMEWLGLDADEGPFYQTQRYPRYREVIRQWLAEGKAYHCYCSKEELEEMRDAQLARKEKPRYDGRCRDRREPARRASRRSCASGIPAEGAVVVDDVVHGDVVFQNAELDDLIIERSDGKPTYNFCVVVDDYDMKVTHVIRGDDHLNNTPRQMNMLRALGVEPPVYAHLPMILGPGRHEALEAPRRGVGAAVPGGGLPARSAAELPRAPRLVARRPGDLHARGDDGALRHRRRQQVGVGDQSRQARLDQPAAHHAAPPRAGRCRSCAGNSSGWASRSAEGAPLEAVIEAQRERAKTLREMARGEPVLLRGACGLRRKGGAQAPDGRGRAGAGTGRGPRSRRWRTGARPRSTTRSRQWPKQAGSASARWRSRCASRSREAGVSPPIDQTLAILGREETIRRVRAALVIARN